MASIVYLTTLSPSSLGPSGSPRSASHCASHEGETIVVNLHGALVKTSSRLEVGAAIAIHVQLTGKSADARVVFASLEHPLGFGIALDKPQNIWGISLPPADWREHD